MISLEITKEDELFKKEYDTSFEKVKGLLFLQNLSSATCSMPAAKSMEDNILEYFKLPISKFARDLQYQNPNTQKTENPKPRPKPLGLLGAYVWLYSSI